jgi:hypothetical protein
MLAIYRYKEMSVNQLEIKYYIIFQLHFKYPRNLSAYLKCAGMKCLSMHISKPLSTYKAIILPVILYNYEIWHFTAKKKSA